MRVARPPLLEVRGLRKLFPIRKGFLKRTVGHVRAVDGVDFHIDEGETLALVGESGCGKTTLSKLILRALTPDSGEVIFNDRGRPIDLARLDLAELAPYRARLQFIFQDPFGSLNPRMRVDEIVTEPLAIHESLSARTRRVRATELMRAVGMDQSALLRYPHEFSGGQRQRIGIARALALKPKFIVADEPVSALDVSIQAQIINLLEELQRQRGLTYLFIAHDLAVVRHISDRVVVMYLGRVMEIADRDTLYTAPLHPYTRALLDAVPIPDPALEARREHPVLGGEVPSPLDPPHGCVFHTRCPLASEACRREVPQLREVRRGHFVACIKV